MATPYLDPGPAAREAGPDQQTAVDKALTLLKSLAEHDREIGVSELARRTGLTKSTTFRLLGILQRNDVIERVGSDYRLGPRLSDIGAKVYGPTSLVLRERLLPHLADLYELTHETVHLAVLHDTDIMYVNKITATARPAVPPRSGPAARLLHRRRQGAARLRPRRGRGGDRGGAARAHRPHPERPRPLPRRAASHPPGRHRLRPAGGDPRAGVRRRADHGSGGTAGGSPVRGRLPAPLRPDAFRPRAAPGRLRGVPRRAAGVSGRFSGRAHRGCGAPARPRCPAGLAAR